MVNKIINEFSILTKVKESEIDFEQVEPSKVDSKKKYLLDIYKCRLNILERDKNFELKDKVKKFIKELEKLKQENLFFYLTHRSKTYYSCAWATEEKIIFFDQVNMNEKESNKKIKRNL